VPGFGFLGAEHFAGVLQHHYVTRRIRLVGRQRGNSHCQVQDLARTLQIHLAGC